MLANAAGFDETPGSGGLRKPQGRGLADDPAPKGRFFLHRPRGAGANPLFCGVNNYAGIQRSFLQPSPVMKESPMQPGPVKTPTTAPTERIMV